MSDKRILVATLSLVTLKIS